MANKTKKQRKDAQSKEQAERDLISEVTTFISESEAADSDERDFFVADLDFVYTEGGQWDDATLEQRQGRPSYTFNRVLGPVNQVIGDQRLNRSSIKMRGVDDKTDQDLADIMAGLIRNIEAMSDAESIYDMAFKYAVAGGAGAWRVVTEFQNDRSFDQEPVIKGIDNPMTVFWDPLATSPVKRDQTKCVIAERISKEFYEEKYGEEGDDIEISRDSRGWVDEKGIRIAEYFKKVPVEKEIALMSDGRVVPYDDELKKIEEELEAAGAPTVEKTRKASTFQVKWWKVDGSRILEGPITYDWRFIPVVKLPGRYINIEGRQKTQSLFRHARDPQKSYNYERTTMTETVANAPRQPYLVTAAMIKGYEDQWNQSSATNRPYLKYNVDPKAPAGAAAPQRVNAAEVPQALISMAAQSADDIKQSTGFFDASLGRQGNEISGIAIAGRQRQADTGSYEFFDNYKKALKFGYEILIDIIPTVMDTERMVRILGLDGEDEFKKINAYDEATDRTNDISQGIYDVVVDLGPTFATQREESFANLLDAAEKMPIIADVAPDLIMKNLGVAGGEEIVQRVRKRLIAQGIVEPTDEEREEMGQPQPAEPDPVTTALVESETAKAGKTRAEIDKTIAQTADILAKTPVEAKQLQSDLVSSTLQTLRGSDNE